MKKTIFIIAALAIVAAVFLLIGAYSLKKMDKQNEEQIIKNEKISEQKTEKVEEKNIGESKEKKEEEALSMEISGLSDEMLSVMGITKKNVSDALKKWTQENGFSSATGAEFSEPMWIRFSESKYSLDCTLILSNQGTGIRPAEENLTITMDYFKGKNLIQFHQ